jgi:DNA-binding CsgD family transcriptional regulator
VAVSCADEGYHRALESGQQPTQTSILAKRALIAVRRGALDDARDLAWRALAPVGGQDFDFSSPEDAMARGGETAIWALGAAALADDDADEAHRVLGPMTEALLAAGIEEPGEIRCLPDEIDALVELGQLEEAAALVARLDGWARRLERPSVLAAACRCHGRLLAAQGKDEDAIELLGRASVWSEQASQPFERGQTLLALGTQQRRMRQRRNARRTLETALAIFEELGAETAAENARAELGRIGGRAPAGDELTASERRIAELVAEGKTNKEVAAILVVAERTVESALTQIYGKLEVRSRTELALRLDRDV